jgi:hypothetical protein
MFSRSNWIEPELRRRNNRYKIANHGHSQVVPIGYSADLKLEIMVLALSWISFERRTL